MSVDRYVDKTYSTISNFLSILLLCRKNITCNDKKPIQYPLAQVCENFVNEPATVQVYSYIQLGI